MQFLTLISPQKSMRLALHAWYLRDVWVIENIALVYIYFVSGDYGVTTVWIRGINKHSKISQVTSERCAWKQFKENEDKLWQQMMTTERETFMKMIYIIIFWVGLLSYARSFVRIIIFARPLRRRKKYHSWEQHKMIHKKRFTFKINARDDCDQAFRDINRARRACWWSEW